MCVCVCVCVLECVMLFCACLLLGYCILYEPWCAPCVCPCSLFQTSVSVFRFEVLRCSRPVPPILQTTADPSWDKAPLCAFGHRVFVRDRNVLKYVCYFCFGPSGVKPFVTVCFVALLGSAPAEMAMRRRREKSCYFSSGLFTCCWIFYLLSLSLPLSFLFFILANLAPSISFSFPSKLKY